MNPYRGEAGITLNGQTHAMRLTLGALAGLEADLGEPFIAVIERFEAGRFTAADLLALLQAGLSGGGADVSPEMLRDAEIAGGPAEAVRAAARLLKLAFTLPGEG
jgi:hypothetical protein